MIAAIITSCWVVKESIARDTPAPMQPTIVINLVLVLLISTATRGAKRKQRSVAKFLATA